MPGFVDVSGWSDQDVKRLGHVDEYDNSPNWNRNRAGTCAGHGIACRNAKLGL